MKILFVSASCGTVYLIFLKFRPTYDHTKDTFRMEAALIPCLLVALYFNYHFDFLEVRLTPILSHVFSLFPHAHILVYFFSPLPVCTFSVCSVPLLA